MVRYGIDGGPGVTPQYIAAPQTLTDDGVLLSFDAEDSQNVLLAGLTRVLPTDSFAVIG